MIRIPLGAVHDAVLPPPDPVQVQSHGPEPVTVEAVPVLHNPVVGVDVRACPLAAPHEPFTAASLDAIQEAGAPPPDPAHVQFHGPEPVTEDADPVLQRFDEGADVRPCPLAVPHTPLTAGAALNALHEAGQPPPDPKQFQSQGSVPYIEDAVPRAHNPVAGAFTSV